MVQHTSMPPERIFSAYRCNCGLKATPSAVGLGQILTLPCPVSSISPTPSHLRQVHRLSGTAEASEASDFRHDASWSEAGTADEESQAGGGEEDRSVGKTPGEGHDTGQLCPQGADDASTTEVHEGWRSQDADIARDGDLQDGGQEENENEGEDEAVVMEERLVAAFLTALKKGLKDSQLPILVR